MTTNQHIYHDMVNDAICITLFNHHLKEKTYIMCMLYFNGDMFILVCEHCKHACTAHNMSQYKLAYYCIGCGSLDHVRRPNEVSVILTSFKY